MTAFKPNAVLKEKFLKKEKKNLNISCRQVLPKRLWHFTLWKSFFPFSLGFLFGLIQNTYLRSLTLCFDYTICTFSRSLLANSERVLEVGQGGAGQEQLDLQHGGQGSAPGSSLALHGKCFLAKSAKVSSVNKDRTPLSYPRSQWPQAATCGQEAGHLGEIKTLESAATPRPGARCQRSGTQVCVDCPPSLQPTAQARQQDHMKVSYHTDYHTGKAH